jgi:hypothetical protein
MSGTGLRYSVVPSLSSKARGATCCLDAEIEIQGPSSILRERDCTGTTIKWQKKYAGPGFRVLSRF